MVRNNPLEHHRLLWVAQRTEFEEIFSVLNWDEFGFFGKSHSKKLRVRIEMKKEIDHVLRIWSSMIPAKVFFSKTRMTLLFSLQDLKKFFIGWSKMHSSDVLNVSFDEGELAFQNSEEVFLTSSQL